MTKKTVIKLLLLNGLLSLFNVVLFSGAFLHISLSGGNALLTAFGVMVIAMSIIVFFYGNYKILFIKPLVPDRLIRDRTITTLDEGVAAAMQYMESQEAKTFDETLKTVIAQVARIKKKKATIHDVLLDRFSEGEMSYEKFRSAVDGIEKIMLSNIRSLLGRISAFDEDEYEKLIRDHRLRGGGATDPIMQSRMEIYNEYITYAAKSVENNEQMLIRLDQLVLEISKLDSLNEGDIADMDAMKEIEALIRDTKWYK